MDWKDINEYPPKHSLKDGQRVDLFLYKNDITGEQSYRMYNCYYDAGLDLFLTNGHEIVDRGTSFRITHFCIIKLPR